PPGPRDRRSTGRGGRAEGPRGSWTGSRPARRSPCASARIQRPLASHGGPRPTGSLRAEGQDGNRREPDDLLGDAAEERMVEAAPAMRAQDDHVGATLVRDVDDAPPGR